jgi:hypothetical protein
MVRKTIGFNPLDQLDPPKGKGPKKPVASRSEIQDAILKPARKRGFTGILRSVFGG